MAFQLPSEANICRFFQHTKGKMNKDSKITKPGFFTIDVEDYYHIISVRGTPEISDWDKFPSRVEYGLNRLFELLDRHNVKASLFFLAYIAQKYPHLVLRAQALGHEICSHGMYHQEVSRQSQKDFFEDAHKSRLILEDISGEAVIGYRSAGFSIDNRNPWFFDTLLQAGYLYDSSIVPNRLHHRLIPGVQLYPSKIQTASGSICEFPIGIAELAGARLNMFGGGYLRFFPKALLCHMAKQSILKRPLLVYIHPREMDPDHPQIPMGLYRKFKSYVNMKSVPDKLTALLEITEYQRLKDYYDIHCKQS